MTVQSIDDLAKIGFQMSDREVGETSTLEDVSLLALRSGLHSFFATHRSAWEAMTADEVSPNGHSLDYCEQYSTAIVAFAQFLELRVKRCLAARSPLLVADPKGTVVLLDKLLQKEVLSTDEMNKLKWIEASDALARLIELVKVGSISDPIARVLANHKKTIEAVNSLRNRVIHRGVYILSCDSFDEIVARYFLPLLSELSGNDPSIGRAQHIWRYQPLSVDIDPIDLFRGAYQQPSPPSIELRALLKELAFAAYANPVERLGPQYGGGFAFPDKVRGFEDDARESAKRDDRTPQKCPVCGLNTVVVAWQDVDPSDPNCTVQFPAQTECQCCGFALNYIVGNASSLGIVGIEDYFGA